ncbi:MAG TPA: MBOAT family O-acyltransferase, partial [Flavobacteriales bacterium]|nr:MBOAT family O-acyltransferase [Flavobacteriales bacterium]HNE81649.1 MBOAT family O-acyltransferase [Flavobacteriales bacterium]HNM70712.1 MBOAT family O-acyltransferase [Flavobacteriales bacterium]
VAKWRWYTNLFIVFLVSGLWHGANWTYVIWGAMHGAYLVLALLFAPFWEQVVGLTGLTRTPRLKRGLNVLATLILVTAAWVFFRASEVGDAFLVYERLFSTPWSLADLLMLRDGVNKGYFEATLFVALCFVLIDPLYDAWIKGELAAPSGWKGHLSFAALAVAILIFGYFGSTSFIYFQF